MYHPIQTKIYTYQLFLEPEWALSQQPMRPKAEWAIDLIVLVKSNQLVKNIETKQLQLAIRDSAAIVLVFQTGTFRCQWAITYSLQQQLNPNPILVAKCNILTLNYREFHTDFVNKTNYLLFDPTFCTHCEAHGL